MDGRAEEDLASGRRLPSQKWIGSIGSARAAAKSNEASLSASTSPTIALGGEAAEMIVTGQLMAGRQRRRERGAHVLAPDEVEPERDHLDRLVGRKEPLDRVGEDNVGVDVGPLELALE